MSGRLDLLTPWARQSINRESRLDLIEAIPDGHRLAVSVTPFRGSWAFRLYLPDGEVKGPLRVSSSMSLTSAAFYALRHWGFGKSTTYTTDALGFVRNIEDAD
jgi:hypothetical protein